MKKYLWFQTNMGYLSQASIFQLNCKNIPPFNQCNHYVPKLFEKSFRERISAFSSKKTIYICENIFFGKIELLLNHGVSFDRSYLNQWLLEPIIT